MKFIIKFRKKWLYVIISTLILGIVLFLLFIHFEVDKEIDLSLIKPSGSSITKIFYFENNDSNDLKDAKELKEEALFLTRSEWKSIYDMPENLINAFIAVEDKRFFEHKGVDWLRTIKATSNYIFKFDKNHYGGSTITQQLIKNLTGDNEKSAKRKIEEICRAINLERKLGKNEILESYLNIVYLSENCYGVGSACDLYFNKSIQDLSLKECASLASIVQNPKKYDPYVNYDNNVKRSNYILLKMYEQKYITEKEYNDAINSHLILDKNVSEKNATGTYSWFTEALIDEITNDLSIKYNISQKTAKLKLLKGGFNIYSTINPKFQAILTDVYESLPMTIKPNYDGTYPESSCVIIDPKTSNVLAVVGGKGKKAENSVFNRATSAKRPPGSIIKPLSVYAPAIEENIINFSSVFDDTPIQRLKSKNYWPKNSPNIYKGLMPVSYAVAHSTNTVSVKILQKLGLEKSYGYLTNKFLLNLDSNNDKSLAPLALGQLTNGESLLNLTNAYSAFSNGGYIQHPKTYFCVTDYYGNVILNKSAEAKKILSEQSSFIVTKLLEGVVTDGTAKNILLKNKTSVAGKTGSSSNSNDRWFIGYTPSYVCGVWCGYDTPRALNYKENPSCSIFDKIMCKIYNDKEYEQFKMPDGIITLEYCFDSGMQLNNNCKNDIRGKRIGVGYYKKNNVPNNFCTIHKEVTIDSNTGYIANILTPSFRRRKVVLLDYYRNDIFAEIDILDEKYLIYNR